MSSGLGWAGGRGVINSEPQEFIVWGETGPQPGHQGGPEPGAVQVGRYRVEYAGGRGASWRKGVWPWHGRGEGEAAQARGQQEPLSGDTLVPSPLLLPLNRPGRYEGVESPPDHRIELGVRGQATGRSRDPGRASPSLGTLSPPASGLRALWTPPVFPSPSSPRLPFPLGAITWQLPSGSLSGTPERGTLMGPQQLSTGQMMDGPAGIRGPPHPWPNRHPAASTTHLPLLGHLPVSWLLSSL